VTASPAFQPPVLQKPRALTRSPRRKRELATTIASAAVETPRIIITVKWCSHPLSPR
jgi:hypothetical protein